MLWSTSNWPTNYYWVQQEGASYMRWSSFWLLDRNGDRITSGLYENGAQIEELLASLAEHSTT